MKETNLTPITIDGVLVYNLKQTTELLNLSYSSLRELLDKKNIQRHKLGYGRDVYVRKEDIDDLLTLRPVESGE